MIGQDSESGRLTKCKLLGKIMLNAPATDVTDWLYNRAQDNAEIKQDRSSNLAEVAQSEYQKSMDWNAKDYGETILGATDSAVLLFFKDPQNQRILQFIKDETYPEYASKVDPVPTITEPAKKTTSKK